MNGFDTQYEQYIRSRHFALDTNHSDVERRFYYITDTTMAENEVFDGMRFSSTTIGQRFHDITP